MSGKSRHVWTWPIATYLFVGGLGAGMTIVAAVCDLFFGWGFVTVPCAIGAMAALCVGSGLLIFELGRPLQFWRVFSAEKAVLTFGAWMIVLLVVFDMLYFSSWLAFVPWNGPGVAHDVIAWVCIVLGCGVLVYTGIELSSMKARVFWNNPALPVLFALSGLLAGAAGDCLIIRAWPYGASFASTGFEAAAASDVLAALGAFLAVLAVLNLVSIMLYAVLMRTSSPTPSAREAAARWLGGKYAAAFWGGLVTTGLVMPLVLLAFRSPATMAAACALFVVGGAFLRFLVVYTDDRRKITGEALFEKRLPCGDEPFLKADW